MSAGLSLWALWIFKKYVSNNFIFFELVGLKDFCGWPKSVLFILLVPLKSVKKENGEYIGKRPQKLRKIKDSMGYF